LNLKEMSGGINKLCQKKLIKKGAEKSTMIEGRYVGDLGGEGSHKIAPTLLKRGKKF